MERSCAGEAETVACGRDLGAGVRAGDLLALDGELGAGKTTLVRGIAAGLGIDPAEVRSPTFVLHHVYGGGRVVLHHIDCYRLGPVADLGELDLDGLLAEGAVALEWASLALLEEAPAARIVIEAPRQDLRVVRLVGPAPARLEAAMAGRARR